MSSESIYPRNPKEYTGPRVTNTETFIQKAKWVHGGRYDYSFTEYIGAKYPVCVNCLSHGEFRQCASNHLQGYGCQECSTGTKKTLSKFIQNAKSIHGDKYDYSLIEDYVNAKTKLPIICPDHGTFHQSPDKHLQGGCRLCGIAKRGLSKRKGIEDCVRRFRNEHGDRYDYSLCEGVNYENIYQKVPIICSVHGVFEQSINKHIFGRGCPECVPKGWKGESYFKEHPDERNAPAFLYIIRLSNKFESFIKVGISKNLDHRFYQYRRIGFGIEPLHMVPMGYERAFIEEQEILNSFYGFKYYPSTEFGGYTECLSLDSIEPLQNYYKFII